MKDYVTQIKEIKPFKEALLADMAALDPSGYVYLNDDGEPKLNFTKTGIIPTDGIATVAICRISEKQKAWFEAISPHAKILGEPVSQYIQSIDDVVWISSGKATYHKLHKQDKIDNGDGTLRTPPLLHCVIAS